MAELYFNSVIGCYVLNLYSKEGKHTSSLFVPKLEHAIPGLLFATRSTP